MAQRKPPVGKPAARSGSGKVSDAAAAKAAAGKSGARTSSGPAGTTKVASKSTGSKATVGKPAGAKRPPAKKGKSIVNQKQTPWALIASVAAIVVFAAVIVIVVVATHSGSSSTKASSGGPQIVPAFPSGTAIDQKAAKQVANTTGVKGVIAFDTSGYPASNGKADANTIEHQHVTTPVNYSVTPPVGGPHDAIWMNAGVYTKPIPSVRAVHNLEHGAVWITYNPNLPASQVTALRAFVTKQKTIDESQATGVSGQANRYIDLSPWASNSLPSPIVISSWGYQLRVSSPTDSRLQSFVDTFRNSQKYTPEYGSAVDGIPVQTGGRPAYDGGTKANPAGSQSG